jgi:hypothetical protein
MLCTNAKWDAYAYLYLPLPVNIFICDGGQDFIEVEPIGIPDEGSQDGISPRKLKSRDQIRLSNPKEII